ncbi:hypothetical protein EWW49_34800, partial [Pseudomonas syringae]
DVRSPAWPYVGASVASMVELYRRELVARDCADLRLIDIDPRQLEQDDFDRLRRATAEAFRSKPMVFGLALRAARDAVGQALATSLPSINPDTLRLDQVASAVVAAAGGQAAGVLEANFVWREIISAR